ncbi:hypothetical protein DE146DRAFT_776450 [Phaeosphaeria sp. MPI-PUGE-AT-0046c]|nr:hypothetical protein DE146DRAFT_776450 [Phaeosphaeria sp. MPI-PUGE-AT-0046c]
MIPVELVTLCMILTSVLKVLPILIFALVPCALPLYWSSPSLQAFLPSLIQQWIPSPSKTQDEGVALSSERILAACPAHKYTSEIISLDPLVIYINNFTSAAEASELISIGYANTLLPSLIHPHNPILTSSPHHSAPDFDPSFISRSHGPNSLVSGRTSHSAPLEPTHPLVSCILSRARTFLGSSMLSSEPFSVPQLVRYHPGQKYNLHTDFWPEHQVTSDGSGRRFNRASSFFVYLHANCTGGETWFPRVEIEGSEDELVRWYGDKVARGTSEEGEEMGVRFKPVVGSAIFWVNLDKEGNGDRRVVHAGLEVQEGEKIGLNIWPRRFFGWDGEEEEVKREREGWSGKWKE